MCLFIVLLVRFVLLFGWIVWPFAGFLILICRFVNSYSAVRLWIGLGTAVAILIDLVCVQLIVRPYGLWFCLLVFYCMLAMVCAYVVRQLVMIDCDLTVLELVIGVYVCGLLCYCTLIWVVGFLCLCLLLLD